MKAGSLMETADTVDAVPAIPPAEIERLFARVAVRSIRGLFADYGVVAEASTPDPHIQIALPPLFGRIGFTGTGLCGSVVMGASSGPLQRSFPVPGKIDDWVAELTNQLMGRIKNEMLRSGIQLQQELPSVITVDQLREVATDLQPWILAADDGIIGVGIDLDVADAIAPDPTLLNWDVPPEGELLLF
jgi:hypothetical protein